VAGSFTRLVAVAVTTPTGWNGWPTHPTGPYVLYNWETSKWATAGFSGGVASAAAV
jgi:hypothetical protein